MHLLRAYSIVKPAKQKMTLICMWWHGTFFCCRDLYLHYCVLILFYTILNFFSHKWSMVWAVFRNQYSNSWEHIGTRHNWTVLKMNICLSIRRIIGRLFFYLFSFFLVHTIIRDVIKVQTSWGPSKINQPYSADDIEQRIWFRSHRGQKKGVY